MEPVEERRPLVQSQGGGPRDAVVVETSWASVHQAPAVSSGCLLTGSLKARRTTIALASLASAAALAATIGWLPLPSAWAAALARRGAPGASEAAGRLPGRPLPGGERAVIQHQELGGMTLAPPLGVPAPVAQPAKPPYDCDEGFAWWEDMWSGDKKAYCCEAMDRGCEGCTKDGDDCRGGARCCRASSKCFVKDDYWASCNSTCGIGEDGLPWNCAVLPAGAPAPAAGPAAPAAAAALPPPAAVPAPAAAGTGAVVAVGAAAGPSTGCSWEGEDCSKSKCCRRVGFKCWAQNQYWASCSDDCAKLSAFAPAGVSWSCQVLGGDQGVLPVPQAPVGQGAGTSLFCFAVVTADGVVPPGVDAGYEQVLLDSISKAKASIFACEASAVYQGGHVTSGDWSSVVNTDVFTQVWNQVKAEGKYLQHDWTVKADVDAVFFPDRLRAHLVGLRPPPATAVYLHNINFKFHFMGALEVLSKEAVTSFLENMALCKQHLGTNGGEDFFTMQCLDAVKVGHMEDFKLLNDKYSGPGNFQMFDIDPCQDPDIVAFHPYKAVNSWMGCYQVAMKIKPISDFVGCVHRWDGEACSGASQKDHF